MGDLIFAHGGYKKLKSFQIARLVYDLTVIFADHYIDSKSRTKDQMVHNNRCNSGLFQFRISVFYISLPISVTNRR